MINAVTEIFFSDRPRHFLISVFKLFILLKMSQNYQKCSKSSLQKSTYFLQQGKPDFLKEFMWNKWHTRAFPFICLWSEDIIACKALCFTASVEFSAACPLCLHGNTVKIMLHVCHAQSINSPNAPWVSFGLPIPVKYHNTLGRQKNANLLLML